MNSRISITAAMLFVFLSGPGLTDDFAYVSDEELTAEWERRKADVERTRTRIRTLQQEHELAMVELDEAKMQAEKTEDTVTSRARIFYRISRRGTALKVLFGSDSPVQVLKRFNQLKYLLNGGVKDRQQANVRLETARTDADRIRNETEMALTYLTMLEDALRDIRAERWVRNAP